MWDGYRCMKYTCRVFTLLSRRDFSLYLQRNDCRNRIACFRVNYRLTSISAKQTYPVILHDFHARVFSQFFSCRMNNNAPFENASSKSILTNSTETCLTSRLNQCSSHKTYEETIEALNGLQSNSATILKSQKDATLCNRNRIQAYKLLSIADITQEDLKSLNIIHVAGTKGKGSTCAYTDSILRSFGFKTGFFSSPHLVVVRERIRINGKPISQSDFVTHFWEVYNKILAALNEDDVTKPPYFMFLTLMAFHIFIQEKVDVAVIEVGIGGEYDSTNIIDSPAVVGLTSIGLDHTSLLGDTLEKIAWQKSGILKEGIPAFTVPQTSGVLSVFLQRAAEAKCPLYLSPDLISYSRKGHIKVASDILETNISLALQLSNAWLKHHQKDKCKRLRKEYELPSAVSNGLLMAENFELTEPYEKGIKNCIWLGRFQKFQRNKVVYFLDGAHTLESIECCSKWFQEASFLENQGKGDRVYRVLLFNCTKGRKPETLLPPLADINFDMALFCTNNVEAQLDSRSDLSNFNSDRDQELKQCLNNLNMWCHLQSSAVEEQFSMHSVRNPLTIAHCQALMVPLVSDAIFCLENPQSSRLPSNLQMEILEAQEVHVLVTGSLLLVGSMLSVLDPELQCS